MPWVVAGAVGAAAVTSGVGAITSSSQKSDINSGKSAALSDLSPYTNAGTNALTSYTNLLGLNGTDAATSSMSNFTSSPGYGYQVSEGLKAVDQGAAAKGLLRSGATLKAEETLGSNLANQDFSAYLSRLSGLTSTGLTAASGSANVNTGAATNNASIDGSSGKTYASSANTIGGALSDYFKNNGTSSSGSVYIDSGTWT